MTGPKVNGRPLLTVKQLAVLALIAEGFSVREAAEKLFVTESSARSHLQRSFPKLGACNAAHAVHLAHRKGYLR